MLSVQDKISLDFKPGLVLYCNPFLTRNLNTTGVAMQTRLDRRINHLMNFASWPSPQFLAAVDRVKREEAQREARERQTREAQRAAFFAPRLVKKVL